ncbi:hypothetical protein D3C71_894870 [compost metagenome]
MAEVDGAIGQAPGACELDVVGAQHLQHFCAHQPHDQRELENRQRDGRQRDVVPALGLEQARAPPSHLYHFTAPEAGEPAQGDSEHQDQQDADQERWQRHAQQ